MIKKRTDHVDGSALSLVQLILLVLFRSPPPKSQSALGIISDPGETETYAAALGAVTEVISKVVVLADC